MTIEDFERRFAELARPGGHDTALDVTGIEDEILFDLIRSMINIRCAERQLADGRRDGLIGGPVHLGVGQEAIAVGVSQSIKSTDHVFGAHRSHSHILALGGDVFKLFAEVLGRDAGFSRGMGGSMHLWDRSVGFSGSVPIVAGTVPLAVGAALAAKQRGSDEVAIAYLGDGAVEEGVVHESLNLSKTLELPVIFVIENNLYASHMHISERQPLRSTARFGAANGIYSRLVDGNDVVEVMDISTEMISRARAGQGPGLLEAITYRWYGHVDWRMDIDVGLDRTQEHVESWKKRDPIKRLSEALVLKTSENARTIASIEEEVQAAVLLAWDAALNSDWPSESSLIERVFKSAI